MLCKSHQSQKVLISFDLKLDYKRTTKADTKYLGILYSVCWITKDNIKPILKSMNIVVNFLISFFFLPSWFPLLQLSNNYMWPFKQFLCVCFHCQYCLVDYYNKKFTSFSFKVHHESKKELEASTKLFIFWNLRIYTLENTRACNNIFIFISLDTKSPLTHPPAQQTSGSPVLCQALCWMPHGFTRLSNLSELQFPSPYNWNNNLTSTENY